MNEINCQFIIGLALRNPKTFAGKTLILTVSRRVRDCDVTSREVAEEICLHFLKVRLSVKLVEGLQPFGFLKVHEV